VNFGPAAPKFKKRVKRTPLVDQQFGYVYFTVRPCGYQ